MIHPDFYFICTRLVGAFFTLHLFITFLGGPLIAIKNCPRQVETEAKNIHITLLVIH